MQKVRAARLILAVLLCLFLVTLSASAQVRPAKYSNKSLKGAYSFLADTWLSNPSDSPQSSLGIFSFDGAGNLTVTVTINESGTVMTGTGTGTYSVAKTGTGSMNITLSFGNTVTFAIVLDSAGKSFQFLQTSCTGCGGTSTDVDEGTATAMGASSFSNASLKGSYEWLALKWTSSQNSNAAVRVGTATFDGVSNVNTAGTQVIAGQASSYSASGTYSVNSDGSGSMNMTDKSGGTFTVSLVINTAGKGFQHMITASSGDFTGYVSDGTATKQ